MGTHDDINTHQIWEIIALPSGLRWFNLHSDATLLPLSESLFFPSIALLISGIVLLLLPRQINNTSKFFSLFFFFFFFIMIIIIIINFSLWSLKLWLMDSLLMSSIAGFTGHTFFFLCFPTPLWVFKKNFSFLCFVSSRWRNFFFFFIWVMKLNFLSKKNWFLVDGFFFFSWT